ncbi:hypothetical protein NLJ89_g5225 [Agrocybe chaxingu]|uniref:Uncharacterized protein n=1 Tax=Agrocybe chaxingu TaxID=84603 RepID=A0A9W8K2Q1_9AGAR|nr:hypothetical protein NLJ89_g5225 [Agrocybe chaxingu]
MSATKVCFITGANRGIGLALVKELLLKNKDVSIYTAVRDPSASQELKDLSDKFPGKVEIVPYVAADEENNNSLAALIRDKHGYVDVVIPNAGIATTMGFVVEVTAEEMREHVNVNAIASLVLFQVMFDLLKASKSIPKFIPISTAGAGLSSSYISAPFGMLAYGGSKVLLNYVTRRIHFENDWLVTKGRELDKTGILKQIKVESERTPDEAAVIIVDIIENSTHEKDGGEFVDVYVIAGANRGTGLGLVKELLKRYEGVENVAVIRNPASARDLQDLSSKPPGRIEMFRYVAADEENNKTLAEIIREKHGHVDAVIPNAAIGSTMAMTLISEVKPHEVRAYQCQCDGDSAAESLSAQYIAALFGLIVYGGSKVLLNYITRRIHFENEWLVAFPLGPGVVRTDLSDDAAVLLVDIIENANRENEGGQFGDIDSSRLPW